MVYFKLFESQLLVLERALHVAARMVGTERSRRYCLELVCADFPVGRGQESSPDEILMRVGKNSRRWARQSGRRIARACQKKR